MAYKSMKKLILNANAQFQSGAWSSEEYEEYKNAQQNKIDVFYANGRLTQAQYEELTGLWIETNTNTEEQYCAIIEREVLNMDKLLSLEWWKEAGTRAIKTVAQTAIATIGTSALIDDVNWIAVLSASALAGLLSILTSIATIPDPNKEEENND